MSAAATVTDADLISVFAGGCYRRTDGVDIAIDASNEDYLYTIDVGDLVQRQHVLLGELRMAMLAFRRIAQGPGTPKRFVAIAESRAEHANEALTAQAIEAVKARGETA